MLQLLHILYDRHGVLSHLVGDDIVRALGRKHNRVIDFLNLGIGALRTGIFNVADVLILIGAGLLLYYKIRGKQQPNSTVL